MECLAGRTFAIVDVETSGTGRFDRVIEIGILRIQDGVCVERYRTCVNPDRAVSAWIFSLTGIAPHELEAAPRFEDIADEVERLLSGAIFVAHNVLFDYFFIKNEFARAERAFSSEMLCTVRLSRALVPRAKKHDLSSIIRRYGLVCIARHRALDDAEALWDLLQLFGRRFGGRLDRAIEKLIRAEPARFRAEIYEEAVIS